MKEKKDERRISFKERVGMRYGLNGHTVDLIGDGTCPHPG